MAKKMSMTANAEKDFIEKMGQHFEERWQDDSADTLPQYHPQRT